MARPSMFSSDYEKRMKRRRLNIILCILIIISAAYFGGKYYLDKNNINISFSLFKNKKSIQNKIADDNKQGENNKQAENTQQNQPEQTQVAPAEVEKKTEKLEYKSADGKIYEIELLLNAQAKEIASLKEETGTVKYDISLDKQSIVFEDKASKDIIVGKVDGSFKKISRDSYKTVSTGQTYTKEKILGWYPDYIWAENPKFTADGRVVYVSDLPFIRRDGNLYVWTVNIDGSNHKKIGEFKGNVDTVVYEGIQSDNSLWMKVNDSPCTVGQGSYKLVRR